MVRFFFLFNMRCSSSEFSTFQLAVNVCQRHSNVDCMRRGLISKNGQKRTTASASSVIFVFLVFAVINFIWSLSLKC